MRSFCPPCSQGVPPTPQADAVPVCTATTMADVDSIELCSLRAKPARSVSSGAMDAVARMSETIHSSQPGPTLRADADEDVLPLVSTSWRRTFFCFSQMKLHSSSGGLIYRKAPRPAATRATWRSQSHLHGTKFLCPSVYVPERSDDSNARDRKPDGRLLHQENYGFEPVPPTLEIKYGRQYGRNEEGRLSQRSSQVCA